MPPRKRKLEELAPSTQPKLSFGSKPPLPPKPEPKSAAAESASKPENPVTATIPGPEVEIHPIRKSPSTVKKEGREGGGGEENPQIPQKAKAKQKVDFVPRQKVSEKERIRTELAKIEGLQRNPITTVNAADTSSANTNPSANSSANSSASSSASAEDSAAEIGLWILF